MDLRFIDLQIKSPNHPPIVTDLTDLVSCLPDEILINIISFLPAKCMVATSLISRRWRYLWTFSSRINFEKELSFRDRETPEGILDQLLKGHNESIKLYYCRISVWDCRRLKELDFGRWIPFLTMKSIAKLRIEWLAFEENPYEILTIPSLEELFLGFGYDFCGVQPPSNSCVSLRSLHLKSAILTDIDLDTLINNAPRLERLSLSSCISLDHPLFRSHVLKRLEIESVELASLSIDTPANPLFRSHVLKRLEIESVELASLSIDTPAINTLLLTYLEGLCEIKINAPSLLLLNISNVIEDDEITDIYDFPLQRKSENFLLMSQILDCPSKVAKFGNLQKLYVQIKLDGERSVYLAPVLRNCNNLHELGIVNKGVGTLGYKSTFWKQRQVETFFCLEHHMEFLWIKGFKWHENEMEFLDFFVSKALLLKKLVIWHDKKGNGIAEQVMARASSNLKVIIKPEID